MFDILIRHGNVIDGTRAPAHRADVGIVDDRIAEIGNLAHAKAGTVIDATGKVVAPGFIDVHNHSDAWLLKIPHQTAKTTQGFTTEVLMADGISYAPVDQHTAVEWIYYLRALNALRLDEYRGWRSWGEYMAQFNGRNVQNAAAHVPYANVRSLACGFGRNPPDDYQINLIRGQVEQAMSEGAVGLSTGLDYIVQCFSSTDELVAATAATAPFDGLYVTHMRYKRGIVPGLREAVEIGRRAGVRVHISHLKGLTREDADAVLAYLDTAEARDVDLSFDVYPYLPGSTMLSYLLPYEAWEDGPLAVLGKLKDRRIRDLFARSLAAGPYEHAQIAWVAGKDNAVHQGKRVGDYVREMGRPPAEVLCDLLIEERLGVLFAMRLDEADPTLIEPFLAHPKFMLGSDGIYHPDGAVHPRVYGSATRLLGHYVRERKLFSLEDAIYKLSGYAAERFRLSHRGVLKAGNFADVVVFDSARVADRATFDDPHQHSVGIDHVLVNGVAILRDGEPIANVPKPLPGRWLQAGRA